MCHLIATETRYRWLPFGAIRPSLFKRLSSDMNTFQYSNSSSSIVLPNRCRLLWTRMQPVGGVCRVAFKRADPIWLCLRPWTGAVLVVDRPSIIMHLGILNRIRSSLLPSQVPVISWCAAARSLSFADYRRRVAPYPTQGPVATSQAPSLPCLALRKRPVTPFTARRREDSICRPSRCLSPRRLPLRKSSIRIEDQTCLHRH